MALGIFSDTMTVALCRVDIFTDHPVETTLLALTLLLSGIARPDRANLGGCYSAANLIWSLVAIGQELPVGSLLQLSGSFAEFSRKRPLNLRRQVFTTDGLQGSDSGRWVDFAGGPLTATMHSLKPCTGIAVYAVMVGALEESAAHSLEFCGIPIARLDPGTASSRLGLIEQCNPAPLS